MLRSHARNLCKLTSGSGGQGRRVKNGARPGKWTDARQMIRILAIGAYSIPKPPENLTLYVGARNSMDFGRRDVFKIARSDNEHIL